MLNKVHAQKASWKDFYLIPLINYLAFTEKTQQDPTMLESPVQPSHLLSNNRQYGIAQGVIL